MQQFDKVTAVEANAYNCWQGNLSANWFFRVASNGGICWSSQPSPRVMAFSQGDYYHADPVAVSASFIACVGPVEI